MSLFTGRDAAITMNSAEYCCMQYVSPSDSMIIIVFGKVRFIWKPSAESSQARASNQATVGKTAIIFDLQIAVPPNGKVTVAIDK